MRFQTIKELLLYRYRQVVGNFFFGAAAVILLTWLLSSIPRGFSEAEIQSAVTSVHFNLLHSSLLQAPYHLMQKASIWLLGISGSGLRLPSVILGLLSISALYVCLKRWFTVSTAITGGLIIASSAPLLLLGRLGTPDIMYIFWPSILMMCATLVHLRVARWRWFFVIGCAGFALSLYTPFMIYFVLPSLLIFLMPENSSIWKHLKQKAQVVTIIAVVLSLTPLGWWLFHAPQDGLTLLIGNGGLDAKVLYQHALTLLQALFNPVSSSDATAQLWPYFNVPAIILGLYGFFLCIRRFKRGLYKALIVWAVIALIVTVLFESVPFGLVAMPILILVIIGFRGFVQKWYQLFPRNPYARISALIPVIAIILVLVEFSAGRYFHGIPYSAYIQRTYNNDILLVEPYVNTKTPTTLIVGSSNYDFYSLLKKKYPQLIVTKNVALGERTIIQESLFTQLDTQNHEALNAYNQIMLANGREQNTLRFRIIERNNEK
jgi:4-amino-4-deoxy-L-arabinose transferase-like glycosyltransferase